MTETNQKEVVETIKRKYIQEEKKQSKFEILKELDKKVKTPAIIYAYTKGTIGSLVLGTGMCLAMKVIGNLMPLGIIIGLLGIGIVSTTHLTYKALLHKRRNKYADQIIAVSNELLNEN